MLLIKFEAWFVMGGVKPVKPARCMGNIYKNVGLDET
jgi:hypothetical protein